MGFLDRFFSVRPPDMFADFSILADRNILIVMQDPHTREMWHMYLDSYNCHTIVPKNGVEALNIATTIPVEVAILDVNIKDIDYMEILKVLETASVSLKYSWLKAC